jgi:hypothetical protein
VPCRAGREAEEIVVQAPEGHHFEQLPQAVQLDQPLASYHATYDANGPTLTVHRELVSRVPHGTCSADEQETLRPLVSALRADMRSRVSLATDATTGSAGQ